MSLLLRSSFIYVALVLAAYVNATTPAIELDQDEFKQAVEPSFYQTSSSYSRSSTATASAATAKRKQAVLLIRISFNDQAFTYSRDDFRRLMFSTALGDASVANYYLENSYQDYLIQPAQEQQGEANDGIIDVHLPYDHPDFGANYGSASSNLVGDALAQANDYINFKQYDRNNDGHLQSTELGLVVMVAGYENAYGGASAPKPNVWAHKGEVVASLDAVSFTSYAMFGERHQNHLATIGIISHELGHLLFSLPDLYDRQWDSNGIGRWGLMGLGSWNSHGGYAGSSPAHMMAWSKVKAGFLLPKDVTGDEVSFSLSSTTQGSDVMRIWLDPFRHGEHFLLEFRSKTSLDQGLPGHGLLISHVDDWVGYGHSGAQNDVAEHKLVDIEEADGRQDLDYRQNLGDRLDVYNDAYGQDYFGSTSLPTSSDYHGNSSGIEISNIKVADEVSGLVTLPYQNLGDNLGHDEGGIGVAWGQHSAKATSLIALEIGALNWIHGIDVYSHGYGHVDVTLFESFDSGQVDNPLFSLPQQEVIPGWNRIAFANAVQAESLEWVFLQLESSMVIGRAFSIDVVGEASGRSYNKVGSTFEQVNFDFNQRLLVAGQQQGFSYQIPQKGDYAISKTSKNSAGSIVAGNSLTLFLLMIILALGFNTRAKVRH